MPHSSQVSAQHISRFKKLQIFGGDVSSLGEPRRGKETGEKQIENLLITRNSQDTLYNSVKHATGAVCLKVNADPWGGGYGLQTAL